MVPDASRMNFVDRLIMPWRLPATPAFTWPLDVKENRFLAADLVYILGISISVVSSRDSACHFRRPRGAVQAVCNRGRRCGAQV